jgi:hypothetical protein
MASDRLDRDDLIRGINQVIEKLRAAGQPAGIRIVGGAALALRYFDRRTTTDIDAQLRHDAVVRWTRLHIDRSGCQRPAAGLIWVPLLPSFRASARSEPLFLVSPMSFARWVFCT